MTILTLPSELCAHHDIIEKPKGPVSIGKCKKCGREREYVTAYGYRYNNEGKDEN